MFLRYNRKLTRAFEDFYTERVLHDFRTRSCNPRVFAVIWWYALRSVLSSAIRVLW